MSDAFPMVEACALGQAGAYPTNTCHCGAEKRIGYWQCPTCQIKDAVREALAQ